MVEVHEQQRQNDRSETHRLPPSLLEMNAWPGLIGTMVKFWDSEHMVFRFGEVDLTPTIEEVLTSYKRSPCATKGNDIQIQIS